MMYGEQNVEPYAIAAASAPPWARNTVGCSSCMNWMVGAMVTEPKTRAVTARTTRAAEGAPNIKELEVRLSIGIARLFIFYPGCLKGVWEELKLTQKVVGVAYV